MEGRTGGLGRLASMIWNGRFTGTLIVGSHYGAQGQLETIYKYLEKLIILLYYIKYINIIRTNT